MSRNHHHWITRAGRAFDPRWQPGGVVLLYHRVAALASDPQRLAVSPENFAAHLRLIRRAGVAMPLDEMLARAAEGSLPERAVAVTFDDGYADTLHTALPMLVTHDVPASIFVTTSTIERGGEFWWDALGRLLLAPASCDGRYAKWTVDDRETPTDRHRLYRQLCAWLRGMTAAARQHALDELASRFDAPPARSSDRALTPAEVTALATQRTIQLGSHTHSHASLAILPLDGQRDEIMTGRRKLESWIGAPATTLAYPFGGAEDVPDGVAGVAHDAGVTLACTTQPGRVHAASDRLRLPRLTVRNWSEAEFEQRWNSWTA